MKASTNRRNTIRHDTVRKHVPAPPSLLPPPGMCRVTINTEGDRFMSVDAYVFGYWAAHRDTEGRGWAVTYLPSARKTGFGNVRLDEQQARRLADWLDVHITREELLDWSNPSRDTVERIFQGYSMVTTPP